MKLRTLHSVHVRDYAIGLASAIPLRDTAMRHRNALAILFSVFMLGAAPVDNFIPVTDAMLENPDPADWLMVSRTYDEQRFSPLDQINKNNVAQLRMAWARGLPEERRNPRPSSIAA